MDRRPWLQVLDALYEMGGYGEWPTDETKCPLNPDLNVAERTDLSPETIEEAALTLHHSGIIDINQTSDTSEDKEPNHRRCARLERAGFDLAHDRLQARRNRASNQSVAFLTFVLAVVGISQATALTVQAAGGPSVIPSIVTFASAVILAIVFFRLYNTGVLDLDELDELA